MAKNYSATAVLLIASLLVAVAFFSGAHARLDAHGGYYALEKAKAAPAPPAVPVLSCQKAHGVQAGETCFSVAQGSGLTQDGFLGFNPNINCDDLFVGQWVCLKATSA